MPITSMPNVNASKPKEIAAIDLGSNSFHMVVARIVDGSLQILSRIKQRVHMADGLDTENHLSQEAMDRGLACLALFAERLQGFDEDNVRIVATHTLRRAVNAQQFLDQAAAVLPYPIELISGQEEARLIYLGVAHTQSETGRRLVVDIGGGSTEMVIGEGFDPIFAESRQMGCVSFAQRFFPAGKISAGAFRKACVAAQQKIENLSWQYRQLNWDFALGSSGTIKAIHEVILALGEKDGHITRERLQQITDKVLAFDDFASLKLPGLPDERQAVFVPGLAILCGVFDELQIKEMRFSDGALREGVMYEMEERFRYEDIRVRTALSLAERYRIDREQAGRVRDTALNLYQQWQADNQDAASPRLETLLGWAALLHEVGLSINDSGIHRHSAYILQHTNLPGFNQEQQNMLATLVRFQRKALKLDGLPSFALFKKKQVQALIRLLRMSVLFNKLRQASNPPAFMRLYCHGHDWRLILPEAYLAQNALVQADLEIEQNYLQDIGWSLTIEEAGIPAEHSDD
ncbi:exopolyphosphatase [Plesiomonas shigelloides]|uniref:exopolyphosphatase n=1 Tax=Plesiomonas shigelloides TaxID=703 RepID=UPI0012614190|nr:exopolyphosphatase [Plesiomonas shigelloides]KAB7667057.1 exopolyphosphatase [Plesiomonas shigelloides]